jgi:site-specific DNA-methyltransferase (adenine-specific)
MIVPVSALFSRASDEWATPRDLYAALDAEFHFTLDAAATVENATSPTFLTRERNALLLRWSLMSSHRPGRPVIWLNPPYSKVRLFMAKATEEAARGCTVVCLVPSRTDTRWFHTHVWDAVSLRPQPHVEIRFLRGRLKFGDGRGSAPFPSMIVIFRPVP